MYRKLKKLYIMKDDTNFSDNCDKFIGNNKERRILIISLKDTEFEKTDVVHVSNMPVMEQVGIMEKIKLHLLNQ